MATSGLAFAEAGTRAASTVPIRPSEWAGYLQIFKTFPICQRMGLHGRRRLVGPNQITAQHLGFKLKIKGNRNSVWLVTLDRDLHAF